jgi:chorismate mutase
MSEEENADLSNSEDEVTSTEPETEPIAAPELEPEREVEIISSVTEKRGVEEAATDEAMREQIDTSDVEQPQLISQTKPKNRPQKL